MSHRDSSVQVDEAGVERARSTVDRVQAKPRILIIGGGFAGIAAARALRRADAEVLLIDRRNHHIFQPLLYQVATSILSPADIAVPIRQLEVKQENLSVLLAEVVGISLADRTVDVLAPGVGPHKIAFDFLIVASGMRTSYFGNEEIARFAPGLKTLSDAETIRAKILGAFELAATTDDEIERARQMTFVLVGAGPAGVELAGSLAHLANVTLQGNFRHINPATARIILLDGAKRILPTFSESLSRQVTRRLESVGVEVLTEVKVESVDGNGVIAGGNRISSATVLWTAGVMASSLTKFLGTKTDRAGRVVVDPFLKAIDAAGVFVIGDAAAVMQDGHPVPGVAQAAIQEGRYAGQLIAQEIQGRKTVRPFRYVDKGSMAVVGKNYAVLERGSLRMTGFLTFLAWAFIHILSLPQLQNRLRVQRQWLWSYLTDQRGSRLIPEHFAASSPSAGSGEAALRWPPPAGSTG